MRDPDDWFGSAADDDDAEGGARTDQTGEDWLRGADEPPRRPWYETIDRRIVVVAVLAVALLLAVLAAVGVFSSSSPSTSTPPLATTTAPPTTTAHAPSPRTPTPASPRVPAPTVDLKPGDTGAQVKVLQRALKSLGHSPGTIDGDYGPSTQTAVAEFQRSAGLTADGIAGAATRRALVTALRRSG